MRTAFLAALLLAAAMALPARADVLIDFSITTDTGKTLTGEMDAQAFSNPNDFVPRSILSLDLNGSPVNLPDTLASEQNFGSGSAGGGAGAGKAPAITLDGSILSLYASLSTGTSYFLLDVVPGSSDVIDLSTDYGGSGTQATPTSGFWTATVVPEPPAAAVFGSACLILALAVTSRARARARIKQAVS